MPFIHFHPKNPIRKKENMWYIIERIGDGIENCRCSRKETLYGNTQIIDIVL